MRSFLATSLTKYERFINFNCRVADCDEEFVWNHCLEGHLSVTIRINCSVACCPINVVYLRHVPLSDHDDDDVANDAESTQKSIITHIR